MFSEQKRLQRNYFTDNTPEARRAKSAQKRAGAPALGDGPSFRPCVFFAEYAILNR
jgi:hypothetical protein